MTTATAPASSSRSTTSVRDSKFAWWQSRWSDLDRAPVGRRVPGTLTVALVGLLVAIVASAVTVANKTNLDYGDALAHLTIARRIVDSKSPGFQQLGTVWLPVPHLLLMPFSQIMVLWTTGIAACIVGGGCLVVSAVSLYRIMSRLGFGRAARVAGLAVLLANPSLLYAFTTALTEPVLIATTLACIAGLAGWALDERRLSGGELAVFAGIPAGLAVLTRYEGWAMMVSGSIFVAIVVLRRGDSWRRALTMVFSFCSPAIASVTWWLAYNWGTYGDLFEFLTGKYSARAFAETLIEQGTLTTKGNPGLSLWVFNWAVLETSGLFPIIVGLTGLVVMTARWGIGNRSLIVWLSGTASAFLMFSLVTGQLIMVNDHSLPTGWYNNRYVLSAVPMFALGTAWLVHALPRPRWKRWALGACLVGVAAQCLWWSEDLSSRSPVLAEAAQNHRLSADSKGAARWLGEHYDGGQILMDEGSEGLSVSPLIGVPMRQIYNRSAGTEFRAALAAPAAHARWILMHQKPASGTATRATADLVTSAMLKDHQFQSTYRLVYAAGDFGVYQRIAP